MLKTGIIVSSFEVFDEIECVVFDCFEGRKPGAVWKLGVDKESG